MKENTRPTTDTARRPIRVSREQYNEIADVSQTCESTKSLFDKFAADPGYEIVDNMSDDERAITDIAVMFMYPRKIGALDISVADMNPELKALLVPDEVKARNPLILAQHEFRSLSDAISQSDYPDIAKKLLTEYILSPGVGFVNEEGHIKFDATRIMRYAKLACDLKHGDRPALPDHKVLTIFVTAEHNRALQSARIRAPQFKMALDEFGKVCNIVVMHMRGDNPLMLRAGSERNIIVRRVMDMIQTSLLYVHSAPAELYPSNINLVYACLVKPEVAEVIANKLEHLQRHGVTVQ